MIMLEQTMDWGCGKRVRTDKNKTAGAVRPPPNPSRTAEEDETRLVKSSHADEGNRDLGGGSA